MHTYYSSASLLLCYQIFQSCSLIKNPPGPSICSWRIQCQGNFSIYSARKRHFLQLCCLWEAGMPSADRRMNRASHAKHASYCFGLCRSDPLSTHFLFLPLPPSTTSFCCCRWQLTLIPLDSRRICRKTCCMCWRRSFKETHACLIFPLFFPSK